MNAITLNRLEVFRKLICQEIARAGGSEEDKLLALAATLGIHAESIPAAIGRAAQEWVEAHCGPGCRRRAASPVVAFRRRLEHPGRTNQPGVPGNCAPGREVSPFTFEAR